MSYLRDIWSRRSLVRTFAINDIRIRYRNSLLGFMWSVLEPLGLFVVLYVVFTHIFKNNIPHFELYLFLSLIMWNTFARATSMGSNSIIGRGGIITKIYFPREILPLSACVTSFLMMAFEFGVFFIFVIFVGFIPPLTILLIPVLLIIEFALSLGMGLALSVLNVYYRDIQYIWNVILQAGFYLTPAFYTWNSVPKIKWLLSINPMARIIDMSHNLALYGILPTQNDIIYIVTTSFAILLIGYAVFRKFEKRLAEEL